MKYIVYQRYSLFFIFYFLFFIIIMKTGVKKKIYFYKVNNIGIQSVKFSTKKLLKWSNNEYSYQNKRSLHGPFWHIKVHGLK